MTFDYAKARETMVEQQIRPWEVLDPRVLGVLVRLPREAFVGERHRALAYADLELPLGHGETMLKPVLEGRALQALALDGDESVLEIGTGAGYLTACLGMLAREVVSIERHADLADAALARLQVQGVGNAEVLAADAFIWEPARQFDAICVTGAVDAVPSRFVQWLRPGGRMFIVHGRVPAMQAALLRNEVGGHRTESLFETELPYLVGAEPRPEFKF
ncbi:protein-L-isoaspartate O-methyltransferase [Luteimonas viscosa]|uniref:Protein-L-isoaspartate O-methyltransferase n=1 Tax=Luteimonas viscosa TaxID=1132694 RepID=A0A5D4XT01_9GAMM|nr:protein-L-isoaspartate O-methyltransferase [Luteimonas viscosa]TYT25880.1 protein-L-isoaspartate O-methyltransferase [Luteimonas viscosa]